MTHAKYRVGRYAPERNKKTEVSRELYTARLAVDFKASSSDKAQEAWPEGLQFGAPWSALGPRHLRPDVPGDRPGAPAGTAVVGVASAASLPPFTPVIVSVHFKPTESC